MTPLLTQFQTSLIESGMVRADQVTLYITEATPEYSVPFDPDGNIPPEEPITLGIQPPATLVINQFSGDLIDLCLVCNIILDDMEPAPSGDNHRLKVSAEPLSGSESTVVIYLKLAETIRYIPDSEGPFTIDGESFKRDNTPRPPLKPLRSIQYSGD